MPTGIAEIVLALSLFGIAVLIMRAVGAWMLRINDVITLQKEILAELKISNTHKE
jgi:hypothetical protein